MNEKRLELKQEAAMYRAATPLWFQLLFVVLLMLVCTAIGYSILVQVAIA